MLSVMQCGDLIKPSRFDVVDSKMCPVKLSVFSFKSYKFWMHFILVSGYSMLLQLVSVSGHVGVYSNINICISSCLLRQSVWYVIGMFNGDLINFVLPDIRDEKNNIACVCSHLIVSMLSCSQMGTFGIFH